VIEKAGATKPGALQPTSPSCRSCLRAKGDYAELSGLMFLDLVLISVEGYV
jgi:hypothetical protein